MRLLLLEAFVADEDFCKQAAAVLLCDRGPIDAFIGEPAEEVLEMVRWALSHEDVPPVMRPMLSSRRWVLWTRLGRRMPST